MSATRSRQDAGDRGYRSEFTSVFDDEEIDSEEEVDRPPSKLSSTIEGRPYRQNLPRLDSLTKDSDEDEEVIADVEYDSRPSTYASGNYDFKEENEFYLNAPEYIQEIFEDISNYTPNTTKLESWMFTLVPDFIPATGSVNIFLTLPRPDGKVNPLKPGVDVLEEPSLKQTDPAILHLKLKMLAKDISDNTPTMLKKIEGRPSKEQCKGIVEWVRDIDGLHQAQPYHTVYYTKPMPEVDNLMQPWPFEMEQVLRETGLPTPDLECGVGQYVEIMCNLFDIPTNESSVQSLHMLFTLFAAVKSSKKLWEVSELSESSTFNTTLE